MLEDEEHDRESKSEKRSRILGKGVMIAIYFYGEDQWCTGVTILILTENKVNNMSRAHLCNECTNKNEQQVQRPEVAV